MSREGRNEIVILGSTTTKEVGDRMEVEWTLSARPDLEWTEIFQFAELPDRGGPIDWVMGAGPDVMDDCVRWFVPTARLDDAEEEVRHRLSIANERYAAGRAPDPDDC